MKEEVCRSVVITDDTKLASLTVFDQIRLLLARLSNSGASDIDVAEKVSVDKIKHISALKTFLEKATNKLTELGKDSITIKLSSEFVPYIDEVMNGASDFGKYYDIEVFRKNIPLSTPHYIIVRITKKGVLSSEKNT